MSLGAGPSHINQGDLVSKRLITPARALFPQKVGLRGPTWMYLREAARGAFQHTVRFNEVNSELGAALDT